MRLLQRENADHTAAGAVILEPYASRDLREDRVEDHGARGRVISILPLE